MNSQETVIQLRELKLKGMADAFESILSLPVQNRLTLEVAIARLAEAESQDRRNRKTEMYLKTSRLRYTALIEDIICGTDRNFTKDDLAALADCSFIRRHENLLIQSWQSLYIKKSCSSSFAESSLLNLPAANYKRGIASGVQSMGEDKDCLNVHLFTMRIERDTISMTASNMFLGITCVATMKIRR